MAEAKNAAVASRWLPGLRARAFAALSLGLRSLPSRIVAGVFAAALVSSLAVTWSSTRSIGQFLREKIDQEFPDVLLSTADRIDWWYAQRQLDVQTFAHSATLADNLPQLGGGASAGRRRQARSELRMYLAYVLERFPQYEALFLLGPKGDRLLSVGRYFELPKELRRRLARVDRPHVGNIQRLGGRRVQVASAPVENARGNAIASLHALVGIETLESVLPREKLGESGTIYVVASDGSYLMHSRGSPSREPYARRLPKEGEPPGLADYVNAAGVRVVGSAMRLSRFGWTLVVEEAYDEAFAPVSLVIRKNLGINLAIVVAFSLIAFQMARSIVRPIQALSEGARRIADGETGVTIRQSAGRDEIGMLTGVFNEMSSRLEANQAQLERNRVEIEAANKRLVTQNDELLQVNEMLEQLSITDGLTKLHNHRFFQEHLDREIRRARRTSQPLALILIDIDNFKALNDRYGHACGDVVLRRAAEVMNGLVRETDLLARYGGEEFALVASHTELEGAVALAEKIRMAIGQTTISMETRSGRQRIKITVSVGVAPLRGNPKTFFNNADRALYRAKAQGKDCVIVAGAARRRTRRSRPAR